MKIRLIAALGTLVFAAPCLAEDPTSAASATRDTVTIGLAGLVTPRYEGASDSIASPGGAIRGRVKGVSFTTLGTALFVDIVPSSGRPETKFVFGPVAHFGLSRASLKRVRDPQIVALGKVPVSVDLGGHVGIQRTGVVTSDYDVLALDLAVTHDVTGVNDSLIVTPSINYGTPLSTKAFVGLLVSATHVSQGFGQRYVGVTPGQSLASGLAIYTPRPGFKDLTFGAVGNLSLTGDLRHGLSAFAIGNYSRLLGSYGRSPVVRDRTQLFGGAGLAYTF